MPDMPKLTLGLSSLLIALGAVFYVTYVARGGDAGNWTPLIPALFFGVPFAILGGLALAAPAARKHAMHAAAVLALLTTLAGLGMGLPRLLQWISGQELERGVRPMISMLLMGLFALLYLVASIRSFIQARRNRTAAVAT